jgi:hypothetical protein
MRHRIILSGVFAAAIISLAAPLAAAADHLEPEASILGGEDEGFLYYDTVVAGVLKDAYDQNVVARAIVEPSFQPEYAVGLVSDKGRYSIFTLVPALHLWSYEILEEMESGRSTILKDGKQVRDDQGIAELRAHLPADWHEVKVKRCDAAIDKAVATKILAAWQSVVFDTRFDKPASDGSVTETITLDGTSYHFAASGAVDLAGQTANPDASSPPGQLADMAEKMATYCASRKRDLISGIVADANAIMAAPESP